MVNTQETVIIKIETLSGYLQGLIKGVSKNPNEGYSVMATLEKEKAKQFEPNSTEFTQTVRLLTDNQVSYHLVEVQ